MKISPGYSLKVSEKDKLGIEDLNRKYYFYYLALSECVDKKYLTESKAVEIINKLEERRKTEIFLFPYLSKLNSNINSIISKGLEKVFNKD
jgi:hypothetical protein